MRLTLEEFVFRSTLVHYCKYTYDSVDWTEATNGRTRVNITCPTHGIFTNTVSGHLHSNNGCQQCSGKQRLTLAVFIRKAQTTHGDVYDYSQVEWTDKTTNKSKVTIVCKTHGAFAQVIDSHLNKSSGCAACVGKRPITKSHFLNQAQCIHGELYDYNSVDFCSITNQSKINIVCKIHGMFTQTVTNHIHNRAGCMGCSGKTQYTFESFSARASHIHNQKYDYSKIIWLPTFNAKTKVNIMCPAHGSFSQQISKHVTDKHGCPQCRLSKGELTIATWLRIHNIQYIPQHKFTDCINPKTSRKLPFDFYLPKYNLCIEFHGKQHYEPNNFFHQTTSQKTNAKFEESLARDQLKEDYCKYNSIGFLVIPYNQHYVVDEILTQTILTTHHEQIH